VGSRSSPRTVEGEACAIESWGLVARQTSGVAGQTDPTWAGGEQCGSGQLGRFWGGPAAREGFSWIQGVGVNVGERAAHF